jgi:large subunit ribosomal protein L18
MTKVRQKTSQQRKKRRIKQAIKEKGRGRKVVVSRSNRYLYAQVVDIPSGKTLMGLSDKDLSKDLSDKSKIERAFELGKKLAKQMKKEKIKKVAFDRSGYLFHGRVKSFVDGLRQGGIKV